MSFVLLSAYYRHPGRIHQGPGLWEIQVNGVDEVDMKFPQFNISKNFADAFPQFRQVREGKPFLLTAENESSDLRAPPMNVLTGVLNFFGSYTLRLASTTSASDNVGVNYLLWTLHTAS